jgi:hypothetical protein
MYYLQPLINGKAEEHADIQVVIMGQLMTGFTSIEYTDDQDIQNVHAAGSAVNARVHGKQNPTAKISFLASTLSAFQNLVPTTRRIQEIPEFDVIVTYVDSAYVTKVHVLKNARFKNNGRKAATGDGAIIVDVDLVISNIEYKS